MTFVFLSSFLHLEGDRILQMSVLVEQQDETVTAIEAQADTVQKDMEMGYVLLVDIHEKRRSQSSQFGIHGEGRSIRSGCS